MISIYVIYDTDCHYFRRLPGTKQTLSRSGQSTHRGGRKGLLPKGPRSSAKLQAYNDRAHHCHSKHLLLLNIRVAPPTISRTPTTGAASGRQNNYTVASILSAAPAWWGFAGEGDRHRLERLVARMRRSGCLPPDFPRTLLPW